VLEPQWVEQDLNWINVFGRFQWSQGRRFPRLLANIVKGGAAPPLPDAPA
jgi:hypothetical protein